MKKKSIKKVKQKTGVKKSPIHWNAMGAGLVTASFLYPEQQSLLLSLGSSSLIMGILEKWGKKKGSEQPA